MILIWALIISNTFLFAENEYNFRGDKSFDTSYTNFLDQIEEIADPDSDLDGVNDYEDYCPNTPHGLPVWTKATVHSMHKPQSWIGCGGGKDTWDPKYNLPKKPDSSLFGKVLKLYDGGSLPEFTDFDTKQALLGKIIESNTKDTANERQLITLDLSDPIIGKHIKTDVFLLQFNDKPFTIVEGQQCLAGSIPCVRVGNLSLNKENKSIDYSFVAPVHSQYCSQFNQFRKAQLTNGTKLLIRKSTNIDTRPECNPNSGGQYNGEIVGFFYTILN